MQEDIKEVRIIEQEVVVGTEFFCDACAKTIGVKILFSKKNIQHDKMFYEVKKTSYWSDAMPVTEYKHACSGECLHALLSEYINDNEKRSFSDDRFDIEIEYTNKDV